jgi:hypothetical protein
MNRIYIKYKDKNCSVKGTLVENIVLGRNELVLTWEDSPAQELCETLESINKTSLYEIIRVFYDFSDEGKHKSCPVHGAIIEQYPNVYNDAFPTSISFGELDFNSSGVVTVEITWRYGRKTWGSRYEQMRERYCTHDMISEYAHRFWVEDGCPDGEQVDATGCKIKDVHWKRAEEAVEKWALESSKFKVSFGVESYE